MLKPWKKGVLELLTENILAICRKLEEESGTTVP